MSRSSLSKAWFFPFVVTALFAGHAFDLIGTYGYQPNFEYESNPIFRIARRLGYTPSWPTVILIKTGICVVCAIGLRQFLGERRRYYRAPPTSFRQFITHFLY
jgi:hypothetical protein